MSRLTDAIENLERQLNRYRADDGNSLLNRRIILRDALEAWGGERYKEGHADGMRDVDATRREAERRAEEAAEETEGEGSG